MWLGLVHSVASQLHGLNISGSDCDGKRSAVGAAEGDDADVQAIPSGISLHFRRPIFPNLPYSPLSSPLNLRRRPLKQSRHVIIEKTGQYMQLNQYLLKDPIGQVITPPPNPPRFTNRHPSTPSHSFLVDYYIHFERILVESQQPIQFLHDTIKT